MGPVVVMMAMLVAMGCGGTQEPRGAPLHEPERRLEPDRRVAAQADAGSAELPPVERAVVVLSPEGGEPVSVNVEVASSEPVRERGLMHRRELAPDAGMLFVFDRMENQIFWMKNTYVALDMIFIDDAFRVVGVIEDAEPLREDDLEVDADSRYVLEVNAGFARAHGVAPGTAVRIEGLEDGDEQAH
jgi:hypothetical protein